MNFKRILKKFFTFKMFMLCIVFSQMIALKYFIHNTREDVQEASQMLMDASTYKTLSLAKTSQMMGESFAMKSMGFVSEKELDAALTKQSKKVDTYVNSDFIKGVRGERSTHSLLWISLCYLLIMLFVLSTKDEPVPAVEENKTNPA